MRIAANDIEGYAVTTGGLYEEHKALARYGMACPAAHVVERAWAEHVRERVMPGYRREVGDGYVSSTELNDGAWRIRRYYERHVRELDAAASLDGTDGATGLAFVPTRTTLSVEVPRKAMLSLLEHEQASHGPDGSLDHALPLMAIATLGDRLDALKGVSSATYDGHFGPYVTLDLDRDEDTPRARAEIAATIQRHLDAALDYVRLPHVVLDMAARGTPLPHDDDEDAAVPHGP